MSPESLRKLAEIEARYHDLEQQLSSPELIADQRRYREVAKARARLEPVIRTFEEAKKVIADVTRLINEQDYDGWRSYLTAEYVARTSDPDFLARASDSGVLRKSGIVLRTLKDYFEYVVVRSRIQASLSDINFVDATHVKALTIVDGRPVILYYLVQEGGRWKVGIWPADQQ